MVKRPGQHRDFGNRHLVGGVAGRDIADIGDAGLVEFMPRMEGTTLHAILAPSKKSEQAPRKADPSPAASGSKPVDPATPATV